MAQEVLQDSSEVRTNSMVRWEVGLLQYWRLAQMKQPPKVPDIECPHCGERCEFDIVEDLMGMMPCWICWSCDAIILHSVDGSIPYWGRPE